MTYEKIVIVTRQTRLDGLVQRFNTKSQARFYIEQSELHAGKTAQQASESFDMYVREHIVYQQALNDLTHALRPILKLHVIERAYLPNYLFTPQDLVVTIGIDGLVVNTAKYLTGQPVIAVNPDSTHIDGVLLPFTVPDAPDAVQAALAGSCAITPITMALAQLNNGQSLLAFNDLFIGVNNHTSARYDLHWGGRSESHSSSGIIVSTGAGSTGWLSSMFNMANGIHQALQPDHAPIAAPSLPWDTDQLMFVVREPFVSKTSQAGVVCGTITPDTPLILDSRMPQNGVIFSDGVDADFLSFNAGTQLTVSLADRKTNLVTG